MKYVLDTHVWIWWHMEPEKLSAKVRAIISNPRSYAELLLSAISIWEFCKLIEKGRLVISCDPEAWMKQAVAMPKFRVVPLTPTIAYRSTILPQPIHSDPADQIILATAREESAALLSADRRLLEYPQVKSIW